MQTMPAVTSTWVLMLNAFCTQSSKVHKHTNNDRTFAAVLEMLSALTGWPADLLAGCPALFGARASRGCCAGAADLLSPAGASEALFSALGSGLAAVVTAADLEASGADVSVVVPLTALATCWTTALVGASVLAPAALLSCTQQKKC
jgi:hypothetical protein